MESGMNQLKETVIRRAWESETFKQKLFADPKSALNELGFSFPHNMEISVFQEHKNKMIFVLPENPLGTMTEFVAGGVSPSGPGAPHITQIGPSCQGVQEPQQRPGVRPPDNTTPSKCRMSEPQQEPVPNATFKGGSCNTAVHCATNPDTPPAKPPLPSGPAGASRGQ